MIPGGAPPPWGTGPLAVGGLALIENLGVDTPQTCGLCHRGLPGRTRLGQPPCPLGTSIRLVQTLWTVWFPHSLTLSSVKLKSRIKRWDSNAHSDSAVQSDRGGPHSALPHGHRPPGAPPPRLVTPSNLTAARSQSEPSPGILGGSSKAPPPAPNRTAMEGWEAGPPCNVFQSGVIQQGAQILA